MKNVASFFKSAGSIGETPVLCAWFHAENLQTIRRMSEFHLELNHAPFVTWSGSSPLILVDLLGLQSQQKTTLPDGVWVRFFRSLSTARPWSFAGFKYQLCNPTISKAQQFRMFIRFYSSILSTCFPVHICMTWREPVQMDSVPCMTQQKHKGEAAVTQHAMTFAQMWHSSPEN